MTRQSPACTSMKPALLLALLAAVLSPAWCLPPGLLFHVSFDKLTPDADFSRGDGKSSLKASLELRSAEGVKGAGLLQHRDERCSYPIAGNFDTSRGTFSIWVKPLSWDGHGKKFRHLLTATPSTAYTMLVYLYPVGDEAVFNYIRVGTSAQDSATWRTGGPVDILKRNEWTHVVTTWDSKAVRLYANGKRIGEGLVASPLPKLDSGLFTLCPIDFWHNAQWGDPDEQTICDEVRVFDHALSDDEVLDLYAADVPGGMQGLVPSLALSLQPDYAGKRISVTMRPAHLDAGWTARLQRGAVRTAKVTDPRGAVVFDGKLTDEGGTFAVPLPEWVDGEYVATAEVQAEGEALQARATLSKPPTPWLPARRDWRATRVLEPWTALQRRGQTIRYWNGEVELAGPFPTRWSAAGGPVLAAPLRLIGGATSATWEAPRLVEDKPFRTTTAGTGKLGDLSIAYESLMEFDGLVRADLTLTPPAGGVNLEALALEIPVPAEVAAFYRNPTCQPWDGKSLDEKTFLPYAWLGNETRGLSWFVESAANWRIGEGQAAMTLRRERETVIVRLQLISEPTRITGPLTYTVGFEATPVRPLNPAMYDIRFASGPQFKGSTTFVYGWGQQISALNGRLLAHDPAGQRKLVDGWRATGKESLSYTCAQCTANVSPEYLFFADEWNQPYGATFAGYKRYPDNAPYSIVPVCPRSSFTDFLVWCAGEHIKHDWGGGIYTDIDGATPCDNAAHGCGYTDAFGKSGRTYALYAHRGLSRRLYEACHDAHKAYFSHAHSHWYSVFNAFNDGWCPGEQYSSGVVGKPTFYMDEIPDRVWRSEFYSGTTGVATFLLPQLGRLSSEAATKDRGPSEVCVVAAMAYGAPLWAGSINQQVTEEVWAAQQQFGMAGVRFVPFWQQTELLCSDPAIRVSLWQKPGRWLVVVANFTGQDRQVELRPAAAVNWAEVKPAWNAQSLVFAGGVAKVTVPAKRGMLLTVVAVQGSG